jgi:DNA polymerase-4
MGVPSVTSVKEARRLCPEIILIPQKPWAYRRAHNHLLAEISRELKLEAVKSIDEFVCLIGENQVKDIDGLTQRIRRRVKAEFGEALTISLGFSVNRLLAKMACKLDKPNGAVIVGQEDILRVFGDHPVTAVPGIAKGLSRRLAIAGIGDVRGLVETEPRRLRRIMGSLLGERIGYLLQGYDFRPQGSNRALYGHARVLAPDERTFEPARQIGKALLIKAARRMRDDGYAASSLSIMVRQQFIPLGVGFFMPMVFDDVTLLRYFALGWKTLLSKMTDDARLVQIGVTLSDLAPIEARQGELFGDVNQVLMRREKVTSSIDAINERFGATVVSHGPWFDTGSIGAKISFTSVPSHKAMR